MLIKNISASTFEDDKYLPGVKIFSGQSVDLSGNFTPQQIHQSKRLGDWMAKGLLLNLGIPKPKNKQEAIEKTKKRLAALGLTSDKMITVKAKKPQRKINPSSLKREAGIEEGNKDTYRYKDRYRMNTDPNYLPENSTETDRENRRTKPEINTSTDRKSISLENKQTKLHDPNGIQEKEKEQTEPGVFETGDLVKGSPASSYRDNFVVKNTEGKELFVNKDAVRKIYSGKCNGIGKNRKACKKQAITGFENCLFHLTSKEKEKYLKLKSK